MGMIRVGSGMENWREAVTDQVPETELRIWVCLGLLEKSAEEGWDQLSAEEQERAMRFRFENDRRRFAGSRLLLRTVLGRELGCDPREVSFVEGKWGKPAVAGGGVCGRSVCVDT